ncbi:hypothetical protein JD844_012960 [Phrynosoma platyrhinos]|uniref:Uncharacterized protein n=1 Tax=Phrynosoma platyrhinos TaxID=52577 RepID=A0ABQ7TLF8_PHRPL|nr:hypothetical protein JD844_012960 [Phrynosoma platyrhinos]
MASSSSLPCHSCLFSFPTLNFFCSVTTISEDVAKKAFAEYVASKHFYSKDPAREMVIYDSKSFNTYRYRLETFSESRSCKWKSEPYNGQPVNPSLCTEAPYPWDVPVEISPMFEDQKTKVRVPCTSSVEVISKHGGGGGIWNVDIAKVGVKLGALAVVEMDGKLTPQEIIEMFFLWWFREETVLHLFRKRKAAYLSSAKNKMVSHIKNPVEKNHIFEYVKDHGFGFPIKLFEKSYGQEILFDEQDMVILIKIKDPEVSPVMDFPENTINEVSQRAVEQHRAEFITPIPGQVYPPDHGNATWNAITHPRAKFPPTMHIRRQKQIIELLYLTRVEYEWHGKHYSYYVYGNENNVYVEYYPKKYFCNIM